MSIQRHMLIGAALGACTASAVAQEQNTGGEFRSLEEIVVTAQKRAQSLQEVPIAISALTAEALENAGVQDIYDVAEQAPSLGVQQNTNPLATQFRMRGIGSLGNIPNFEPAVAYFVDGAYRARSGLGLGDLVDVERIELLKGPQSTLYGKNSSAGVVAVHTREPGDAFEFTSELKTGVIDGPGDASTWQAKASAAGPVSEAVSLGLSGSYFDQEAVFDNLFTGDGFNEISRYSVRGQMAAQVSDAFKLRLILGHAEILDGKGAGEGDFFYGTAPRALNAAFGAPCADDDPTNRIVCRNFAGDTTLDSSEATLIATYDFAGGYQLTSLTSWDEYEMTKPIDADQLNLPLADFNDRQAGEAIQQELRIASPTGAAVDWLGGVFYYQSDYERGGWQGRDTFVVGAAGPLVPLSPATPAIRVGQPGDAGSIFSTTETEYFGVFAQTTWRAAERFNITAGARWQTESKDTNIQRTLNHATPSIITIALLPATVPADLSRDTDAITWSLTPQWFITDDAMTYVTASRGFKSGGFNGDWGRTLPAQREFKDEEVDHYELGLKTMLADHRVQLNLAAFYSDFTNYQEAGFVALQFLVTNAEAASVRGVEVDFVAELGEAWTAELNATYADARFDEFSGGACYPGRTPDNAATGSCDLSGANLATAPELKTHAALQYERAAFYARADWTWTGDYITNSNQDPRHVQDAFSIVDARLGWRFGGWDLSIWGENLLNEDYITQAGVANLFATDPAYQTYLGQGRSYGVAVKYRL